MSTTAVKTTKPSAQTPAIITEMQALPMPAALYGKNVRTDVAEAIKGLRNVPQVETEADKTKLEDAIKAAQKITKVASDKRLDVTRVFDGVKSVYMQAEKDLLIDLAPELQTALNNVTAYNRKKLADQREAERVVAENAAKEAARKRSLTSVAKVEDAKQVALTEVAEAHKTSGVSTVWKSNVTSPELVPREFCSPDPAKIAAAVARGTRVIAGVNIYEDVKRTGR